MSANERQFSKWSDVLDYKAKILYSQIALLQKGLSDEGGSEEMIDAVCAPYRETLKSMYAEDYPLAKAMEESDLLVSLEGPAISRNNPKISIISSVFGKVRVQVAKVAKTLANIGDTRATPSEMDLGLSAFARGSLILGFTLPTDEEMAEKGGQTSLFSEQYLRAAREAVKTLGIVTQHITEGRSLDDLSSIIPDVRVRETALAAVKEFAPTTRSGINTVRISAKAIPGIKPRPLTPEIRETVNRRLLHPVTDSALAVADRPVSLIGDVREIDLDAHRFDLRHIERMEINDVRCSYLDASDEEAKEWLNRHVRVTGIVERDPQGRTRLLEITTPVEVLP